MYNNVSEIAAHKKECDPKYLFLKIIPFRLLRLVAGNSFFQGTRFFYSTKVGAAIHSSMDTVFFRRTLAPMNCVYAMYLTGL